MNFSEDVFLNFHAHQAMPEDDEVVIQSLFLQDNLITSKSDKIFFTAGLHPWHADQLSKIEVVNRLEKLLESKLIIAIGETGLDKLKGPSLEIQTEILKAHVEVAEKYNLPVIVHSVKTHNEILKLNLDLKSKVPWVLHHFNGSKQMALDFIHHGFYLSLSYHINNENSRLSEYIADLPLHRIFLETDDFNIDIKSLYKITAEKYRISIEELKKQIITNLNHLVNGK
ncbi:MAG TPA: hypothetical protein DCG75_12485 [Bacteroidales bacterium]|nr:hypothetical protein [Bacteroidales bacterium]